MSEQKETVVVDANPLLSTLRGGKARSVLFSGKFIFVTTEHTTWEVKKYIPELANQSGVPESELFYAFDRLPVIVISSVVYDEKRKQAENFIAHRDPKDVDILALALKFDIPLWTNDTDFDHLPNPQILTTADMLEKLGMLTG
jgi:predicted nucleic acid-binding protein